jgi:hypothetical protein
MTTERFGQLRSILQQTPSIAGWEALCAELALWGAEALEREALPYAASILERWPAEIERVADEDALRRWEWRGELGAACRLATRLPVRSPEQLERVLASGARLRGLEVVGGCTREQGERYAGLMGSLALELLEINLRAEADEARDPSGLLERVRMPSLRRLRVYTRFVGGDLCAAAIAQNPSLTGLVELSLGSSVDTEDQLSCGAGLDGLKALAASPCFEGLRVLGLYRCAIFAAGLRLITERAGATRWEALDLSFCGLKDEDVQALALSPNMAGLRELRLNHSGLTDMAARVLATSPSMSWLRVLDLRYNEMTEAGALAIAHSATLGELERLELVGGTWTGAIPGEFVRRVEPSRLHVVQMDQWSVDAEMAERLATSWPPRLTMWEFNSWDLESGAAIHAARWPQLAQLESLGVSGEGDERELLPLLASPYLTGLRELGIYGVEQGCQQIAANAALSGLRWLRYHGGSDEEALCALAASPHLGRLDELILNRCDVSDGAMQALMSSHRLAALRTLTIHDAIGAQGARIIAGRSGLPALRRLYIWASLDAARVAELVDGDGLCGVEELGISDMNDAMAAAIAASPYAGALCLRDHTGLRTLAFAGYDRLTLVGLKALLEHPGMAGVEALRLNTMALGDGLIALLDHPHLDQLRALTANNCKLTPAFTAQLARTAHMERLDRLDLGANSGDPAFAAPFKGTRLAW